MSNVKRNRIISVARAELGQTEEPPGTNKNKYGKWYGLDGYAWCAMFVSWVYDKAGTPMGHVDDAKGFRYCPSAYQFWKNTGQLTTKPLPGDIVLFDWEGDGRCDHTGIFVKDNGDGKTFTALEGNTSYANNSNGGEVMERKRYYASTKAFVCPNVLKNETLAILAPEFTKGDTNSGVSEFQRKLHDLGYKITVDGEFGPETWKIVKQFQTDNQLIADGKVTMALIGIMDELLRKTHTPPNQLTTGSYLNPGCCGMAVRLLQETLNTLGANPKITADGVFGPETKKAVMDYQRANHLLVDGIAGPQTLKKMKLVV